MLVGQKWPQYRFSQQNGFNGYGCAWMTIRFDLVKRDDSSFPQRIGCAWLWARWWFPSYSA